MKDPDSCRSVFIMKAVGSEAKLFDNLKNMFLFDFLCFL